MKNIETKGNFSIERMDEWVVAEIFHWVGDVCVSLMLQFCQCLVKPNVCVSVCVFYVVFFWCFAKPNVCTQKNSKDALAIFGAL